jgi:hypothetical protein
MTESNVGYTQRSRNRSALTFIRGFEQMRAVFVKRRRDMSQSLTRKRFLPNGPGQKTVKKCVWIWIIVGFEKIFTFFSYFFA